MPAVNTFASTGHSANHDGRYMLLELPLATADTVSSDTSTLSITFTNLTDLSENPRSISYTNSDLRDAIGGKLQNATINDAGTRLTINISGAVSVNAKTVKVKALENTNDGSELMLINSIVNVKTAPSKPSITQKVYPKHSVNGTGTGVISSDGAITVAVPQGESTNKVNVYQRGVNVDGSAFADVVATMPVAHNASSVTITWNALALNMVKADSAYYINAQLENEYGESEYSNSVAYTASVRQPPPTLLTAQSLDNLQVTLTGTVSPSANAYYSIVASDSWNQFNPLGNFYQTNVVNVALSSSSQSTFTQLVTAFKGLNLVSGTIYHFAAIQHTSPLTVNNNEVPLDVTSPSVPLTQSSPSNVLSAVPIAYIPSNVEWSTTTQSLIDNKLMFNPLFVNAASIPANMTVFFDLKINGVSQGVISNDPNIYSVPASLYNVTNPPSKATYELTARFDHLLSNAQRQSITGAPALTIYTDPSTKFSYASVKQFASTVNQNPSTNDVPLPQDFALQTSNVGSVQCLSATWGAPDSDKMAELKLTVKRYEIQAMRGVAGTAPNGFSASALLPLNANGDKTLLVEATTPSNGGSPDASEYTLLKIYSGGVITPLTPGVYSAQLRAIASSDSGDIPSQWVATSYEISEKAMSPPSSVTVTPTLTPSGSTGSSVNVNYMSVASANITGRPANWSGARAHAAKFYLVDKDGKVLKGPETKSFSEAEMAAAPTGAYSSSATFTGLPPGATLYARVTMLYSRVSALGDTMNEVIEGATAQSEGYSIKSKVAIKTIKFLQTPVSSSQRGLDPNGGTSFRVEVELDNGNNHPNDILVKVILPAQVGGSTGHVHDAPYDPAKKLWAAANLAPAAEFDYAKNAATVVAITSNSMDTKSV